MSLKSTKTNGFNFRIISSLIESRGIRLNWIDCKYYILFVILLSCRINFTQILQTPPPHPPPPPPNKPWCHFTPRLPLQSMQVKRTRQHHVLLMN